MKRIHVSDEHRTNGMSLVPGGSVVEVIHRSGKSLVYDKIKMPPRYVREIYTKINKLADPIDQITVDGEYVFNRTERLDSYSLLD